MGFDKITRKCSSSRRDTTPASVSFYCLNKSLPQLRISFREKFVTRCRIKPGDRFILLVGNGEETGLLRMQRAATGPFTALKIKKGGVWFSFGHIPQLGIKARTARRCEAELIEADIIEIIIGDFI